MIYALASSLCLFAVQAILNEAGPASYAFRTGLASIGLLLLVVQEYDEAEDLRKWRRLWTVVCAAALLLAESPLAALVLLAVGMSQAMRWQDRYIAAGVALVACMRSLTVRLPVLESVADSVSEGLVSTGAFWGLQTLEVGTTPTALWTLVLAILVAIGRSRAKWPIWLAMGIAAPSVALFSGFLGRWYMDQIGPHAGHSHGVPPFAHLPWIAGGLLIWHVVLFTRTTARSRPCSSRSKWISGATALLLAVSAMPDDFRPTTNLEDKKVLVLDHSEMDWDLPTLGNYGAYSGGMFGLLPDYLEIAGAQVHRVAHDGLFDELSAGADILMVINCPIIWRQEEVSAIYDFVRGGGGLVVLGDHTNVFGLQDGLNSLLADAGIKFNFDSAYHIESEWARCVDWPAGTVISGASSRNLGVSVGASLLHEYPAMPLLRGQYAFSDAGVRENVVGSFLGNYRLEDGERLGDVTLVAGRCLGQGRMIVFGDTSGFQNGSIPWSIRSIVVPTLNWVSGASRTSQWFMSTGRLALLVAAMVALLGLLLTGRWSLGEAPGVGLIVLVVGLAAVAIRSGPLSLSELDLSRTVLLDEMIPRDIGHYDAGWNGIGPLNSALAREGLLPLAAQDWSSDQAASAVALALVAPVGPIRRRHVAAYRETMDRGGRVIVVGSGESAAWVSEILEGVVTVTNEHMGPVPRRSQQTTDAPRLVDPSSMEFISEDLVSLYSFGGVDFVAAIPGQLLVISDSRFFSARNCEGVWGWWGGNLQLIHEALGIAGIQPQERHDR